MLKDVLKDCKCETRQSKMCCENCGKEVLFFYFNSKNKLVCYDCLEKERKENKKEEN